MGRRICEKCRSVDISQHHVEVCQNRKAMSWHTDKMQSDYREAAESLAALRNKTPESTHESGTCTQNGKFEGVKAR